MDQSNYKISLFLILRKKKSQL